MCKRLIFPYCKMLESATNVYSKCFKPDIANKLQPIDVALDSMLARLEEFETMVSLLHEENTSACGLNGSLMAILEKRAELKNLFERIDALEKLVEHVKRTVGSYEAKVEAAEKGMGLMQTSSMIKDLLKPLLKLNGDGASTEQDVDFKVEDYFPNSDDGEILES